MCDHSDRGPTERNGRRLGFTLLEVMLALAIAVLLLVGLYGAINVQFRHSQAGRDLVEQNTLARSILNRMGNDISATVALSDPARFRMANSSSGGGSGSSGGSGASGSTPSSATTTTGASAASTTGATPGTASTSSSPGTTTAQNAVTLSLGVQGDAGQVTLLIGKVPGEAYGSKPGDVGQVTSDLRQVTYWLAAGGGLARQELQVVTSNDAVNATMPSGDAENRLVIAPEVRSLAFSYFDGTTWQDSWDSTALGPDNLTPMGSPRAIAVTIGIATVGRRGHEEVRTYRHVVAISTANGTTLLPNTGTDPTNPTNGGGTSP